jgi:group I intron endonuclease
VTVPVIGVVVPKVLKEELKMENKVKSRRELNREYVERLKPAGVYQVKNLANGKVLLGSSLNLEGPLNRHKFMLKIGSHTNKALQKDWDELGPDQFVFEILEEVKMSQDPNFNLKDELTLLEQIWLEQIQPFGERGYNINEKIREA